MKYLFGYFSLMATPLISEEKYLLQFPGVYVKWVHIKLTRKYCLTIWLYGTVPHKAIMFQLD